MTDKLAVIETRSPPRFLCDEMLKGLARWLRAAGYDTEMCAPGTSDRENLEQALKEQRWLITRDHKLSEFRNAQGTVILLQSNNLNSCAKELDTHVHVDWEYDPFTRCLLCNNPLTIAQAEQIKNVPQESRLLANPLLQCTHCNKLYWAGGHVERMSKKLKMFAL